MTTILLENRTLYVHTSYIVALRTVYVPFPPEFQLRVHTYVGIPTTICLSMLPLIFILYVSSLHALHAVLTRSIIQYLKFDALYCL